MLLFGLSMLPVIVVDGLLSGWFSCGPDEAVVSRPTAALLVLTSLTTLSIGVVAAHRVLRNVPVHGKK
jgi:hypothetical protein